MAESPDGKREFDRMIARHKLAIERARRDIERARHELDQRLARLRAEMEAAKDQFRRAIERGDAPLDAAIRYRDVWGSWPDAVHGKRRSPPRPPLPRSFRRGLEGGEPVPVEPRPKPKPLIGEAEAPIE